ncbi:HDOD domain-containing protein [Rubrivivax rivuli]|uniref:HDOD domain-containing protein n=1 Tax=Rubrivivax rivuli TaxID=1862385 RepID=A0A437R9E2_9BURK|nr:HDOD domain-containing protein [Rubrivivax rivuli]RVU43353.1 HDOD domain-containing protein [Rubrivivax rivuli]
MNTLMLAAPPEALEADAAAHLPSPIDALLQRARPHLLSRPVDTEPAPAEPVPPAAEAATASSLTVSTAALQARVAQLPPLPEAVLAMVATLDSGSARLDDVAELLQRDQALTARVLRLANSAFYGVPGRVASVHDAVNLIGLRSLRSLVATAALTQQFACPRSSGFDLGVFWRHTVAAAFAARTLAAARGLDEEMAYTAGLLHDVGRLALAAHFPQAHAALLQATRAAGRGGRRLERQLIGTDHAEIGAIVAEHWHLPNPVVVVIARHHHPPETAEACTLVDVIHVADALAHALGFRHDETPQPPRVTPGAWQRVGLERLPFEEIFTQVEAAVADTCTALGL